jgi:bifunctional non-homologous end joining protein LigD
VRPPRRTGASFVVQKHDATRLHYDFRLEVGGVLKSWAVPKGPSLDPRDKRLAMQTEDHPLEYGGFEGVIPAGEYGGGPVLLWDRGTWMPEGEPAAALRKGMLKFTLSGQKLRGGWALVRLRGRDRRDAAGRTWLLVKERDSYARPGRSAGITDQRPESVASGRRIEDIGPGRDRDRHPKRAAPAVSRKRAAHPGPRRT